MRAFYEATSGQSWSAANQANWFSGTNPCAYGSEWGGVLCSTVAADAQLKLPEEGGPSFTGLAMAFSSIATTLTGTIPPEIFAIPSLTELTLKQNSLSGTIPFEIGLATQLAVLDVSVMWDSGISGTLPAALSELPRLKTLLVNSAGNWLTGTLPAGPFASHCHL